MAMYTRKNTVNKAKLTFNKVATSFAVFLATVMRTLDTHKAAKAMVIINDNMTNCLK